jgi:hypothetical protein
MQRALIQYRNPKNYDLVVEALRKADRMDLIGFDKKCLVRPRQFAKEKQWVAKDKQDNSKPSHSKPVNGKPANGKPMHNKPVNGKLTKSKTEYSKNARPYSESKGKPVNDKHDNFKSRTEISKNKSTKNHVQKNNNSGAHQKPQRGSTAAQGYKKKSPKR